MKEILISEVETFYHITPWSKWEKIKKEGLKKFNPEGISVLRTNDDRIVKSVTLLQLQTIEDNQEKRFALVKLSKKRNGFLPQQLRPDLVDEWTWPFHNNIQVQKKVHPNFLELEREFIIENWDIVTLEDNRNRVSIMDSEMYTEALNVIYQDDIGQFRYNRDKSKTYLNEKLFNYKLD